MRKSVPLLLLLLPVFAMAQKNAVKVNLSSLAVKNYHIQYERKLVSKLTLNVGFRYMPKSSLPFQSTFESLGGGLDDEDIRISDFRIGNTAITVEPRIYLSKKAMKGFYIAPYARYASFDMSLPFTYDEPTGPGTSIKRNADFTGKITSFSGGLMFGTQFNIAKRLVLDIWWIGGHYGTSSGDLDFRPTTPLTPTQQQGLKNTLADFKADPFKFTYDVPANGSGAFIKSDGPWAGIRALGINLGLKF